MFSIDKQINNKTFHLERSFDWFKIRCHIRHENGERSTRLFVFY